MTAAFGLTLGYQNVDYTTVTTSSSSLSQSRTSQSFNLSTPYMLNPSATTGLSASVTITRERSGPSPNSTSYSAGPYLQAQVTEVTSVYLTGGLQKVSADASNTPGGGSDDSGFYAEANITNNPSSRYSQQLEAGRQTQLGIISNTITSDYVRYSGALGLGAHVTLDGNLFIDHGKETGGAVGETFLQYGGGLSLSMPLARALRLTCGSQLIEKASNTKGRSYSQYTLTSALDWTF
jgi:hypothetical protein